MTAEQPKCSCGSTQAGLIFIPDENRYQCGDCICRAYADLAEISKITKALRLRLLRASPHHQNERRNLESG